MEVLNIEVSFIWRSRLERFPLYGGPEYRGFLYYGGPD